MIDTAKVRRVLTEDDLFAGYNAALRVEACACGGAVTAPRNDWTLIGAALRLHYLGSLHQRYRQWREHDEPPPTPGFPSSDLSSTAAGLSAGASVS